MVLLLKEGTFLVFHTKDSKIKVGTAQVKAL